MENENTQEVNQNQEQNQVIDAADRGVENKDQQPKLPSFDEFLKDPKNQGTFDKRVAKAIETARTKWEEEAKLSDEERAERQLTEREKALAAREAAHEKREFTADIREELLKNSLPLEFAEVLAEGCTRETITEVLQGIKSEWDKQITEQIKAGARQKDPLAGSGVTAEVDPIFDLRDYAEEIRKVK